MTEDTQNGFIERRSDGLYEGMVRIDGVLLPNISATFFQKDDRLYLWLRRKDVMQYDFQSDSFKRRRSEPYWECYLEKQTEGGAVAYRGECVFLRFRYSVVGIWDNVLGVDKQRMNVYVERMDMSEQTILIGVNESRKGK